MKNEDILESDYGMYTNLHGHSRFSALDGFSDVDEYVVRCKKLGMKGVCFSDHGVMSSAYELKKSCDKHGMKPIFANELYFTPNDPLRKEKIDGFKHSYHILLIAYNNAGYQNLLKLSSDAWTKYRYYKPRVGWEQLQQYSEGIICLSACLGGYMNQLVMEGKDEDAELAALRFKSIYKENFFLEMQWTGIPEQELTNAWMKGISKKHDIPLVITTDCHYIYKEDTELHRALVTINTGGNFKKIKVDTTGLADSSSEKDTDESSMFYKTGQYYLKPYHVLAEYFSDEQDIVAFANTNKIAEKCNVVLPSGLKIFPQLVPDPEKFIMDQCNSFIEKYCAKMTAEDKKRYTDRLHEESWIIKRMGYFDYFTVVQDMVKHAKDNNILVGLGRGSGASSLICFALGITGIDPLTYNLLFSRFLSSARAPYPLIELEEYPLSKWK